MKMADRIVGNPGFVSDYNFWQGRSREWLAPTGDRLRVMIKTFLEMSNPTDICDEHAIEKVRTQSRPRSRVGEQAFFGGTVSFPQTFTTSGILTTAAANMQAMRSASSIVAMTATSMFQPQHHVLHWPDPPKPELDPVLDPDRDHPLKPFR